MDKQDIQTMREFVKNMKTRVIWSEHQDGFQEAKDTILDYLDELEKGENKNDN